MARRIIAGGLGGFIGLAIWYVLVSSMGFTDMFVKALYSEGSTINDPFGNSGRSKIQGYYVASMLGCMFGGGALVLFLGEKLRLVPTQDHINEQNKPPSI